MRAPNLSSRTFDGMMTFEQCAKDADCNVRTIYNWAAEGMPFHQAGKLRLVDPPEVAAWIRRRARRRGRPRHRSDHKL